MNKLIFPTITILLISFSFMRFLVNPDVDDGAYLFSIVVFIVCLAIFLLDVYKNKSENNKNRALLVCKVIFVLSLLIIFYCAQFIYRVNTTTDNSLGDVLAKIGAIWEMVTFILILIIFTAAYFLIKRNNSLSLILLTILILLLSLDVVVLLGTIRVKQAELSERIKVNKEIFKNFNATEVISADSPFYLKFWAEGSCPNYGNNDEYVIPNGYKMISCEQGIIGFHGCKKCIKIELYKDKVFGVEIKADESLDNDYIILDYNPLFLNLNVSDDEAVIQNMNNDNKTFHICKYKKNELVVCTNEVSEKVNYSKKIKNIEFKMDQEKRQYLNVNNVYYGPYQYFIGYSDNALISENSWIFSYMQDGKIYINANDIIYGPYIKVDSVALSDEGWGFSYETNEEHLNSYAVINGERHGPYSTITALDVSGKNFGFIYRNFYKDMSDSFYLETNISIKK